MSVICVRQGRKGKVYLTATERDEALVKSDALLNRIGRICQASGFNLPREPVPQLDSFTCKTHLYGLTRWADLFNARQLACLVAFTSAIRTGLEQLHKAGIHPDRSRAIACYVAFVSDRLADWNSSLCSWSPEKTGGAKIGHTFGRQALHMVWDYAESAVWGEATGSVQLCLEWVLKGLSEATVAVMPAHVFRGSAVKVPLPESSLDAVITDPPYYDNVSYANLSDFFYVWLRRSIGQIYNEHFGSELTPKKAEAVAEASRYGGSKSKARQAYEEMMKQAFAEADRLLKPNGQMIVVYAHKTTLGWATLVEALRRAGFTVNEAWPLDTEMKARLLAMETAALASSIFLVARKRDAAKVGSYEDEVRPELEQIVRERVETLWPMGITGADLIIAAVGAGLRAFTRFASVEYANGEEVPAEKFLAEVEGVVLETLLEKIFGMPRSGVSAVDAPSRFYVLWRYAYRVAELEAGEAIVFTMGQHVELDGALGLSTGGHALVEKKKGKYRLRDFPERGQHEELGLPNDDGEPAPLIDVLHRTLWLMEHEPRKLSSFLDEAHSNRERLRLVAQALAGAGLSGKSAEEAASLVSTTTSEQAALGKLLANWRALVTESLFDEGRRQ